MTCISAFSLILVAFFFKTAISQKLVIDTEPGLDDAVAIVTAFGHPGAEILGITIPSGNTGTEQAATNVLRILKAAGKEIPVFKGSPLPLLGNFEYSGTDYYFGKDGMGDADFSNESLDMSLIKSKHAALALVDFVNENPGEVTIVALGPLTNIALAIRLDSTFAGKTKELHLMGGSPTANGNRGPVVEFNFELDPEAALIVFEEMKCPIYVSSWDLCLENLLTPAQKDNLFSIDSDLGKFLHKIHYTSDAVKNKQYYTLCDSISMAYALNRTIASETNAMYSTIELCGRFTRGEMIVDRKNQSGRKPNAKLVKDMNLDKLLWVIRQGILSH